MSTEQITAVLGGWEGYQIGTVGRFEAGVKGPTAQVWIELLPEPDGPMVCNGCGRTVTQVHETTKRWVRDLPILDAQTYLLVHRRRALCRRCGPRLERLDWLDKYGREVIDRVRVDEANRLREDKKARKVVKSARWLLLRNRQEHLQS